MLRLLKTRRAIRLVLATSLFMALGSIQAAELDPKAINIQLPKDIKWVATAGGSEQAVLVGDPAKPGLYIVLTKWLPNKNSRPHTHPNDRFITVLKGTWWVNTGSNYDPDGMKPVPTGSYVVHYGGQYHYDGAKNEEVILEIVGMGPATSTAAPAAK
jgi:quercetin dioxygenase-like cupin family protein